jgi:CheY-like chemotaxis protein/HPt (histidine-containing phosphotransfer) domain-containing protein
LEEELWAQGAGRRGTGKEIARTPIIMLTSVGGITDSRYKKIGIEGYLTKPVRRGDLYKMIESVLSLPRSGVPSSEIGKIIPSPDVPDAPVIQPKDIRILLVEDYPTNQQVAMRHLGTAGYHVDLAENGHEGVAAYQEKHYDLILMDIQMPGMDGFDATKHIREIEVRNPESPHIPIIAMTAHAMRGYRERCIEGGMDDYITKPLKRRDLLAIVEKWTAIPPDSSRTVLPPDTDDNNGQAPIDFKKALEEFDGDREFLMEVAEGFIKNVKEQIVIIKQALSDGESTAVRKEAHSIKGGASNLCADVLAEIAFELENIGKSGSLENGNEILQRLEQAFSDLEDYIAGIEN